MLCNICVFQVSHVNQLATICTSMNLIPANKSQNGYLDFFCALALDIMAIVDIAFVYCFIYCGIAI